MQLDAKDAAFRVVSAPEGGHRGRYMVTTRDVNEGDTVLEDTPLAVGPKRQGRRKGSSVLGSSDDGSGPWCVCCCRDVATVCPKCGLPMCIGCEWGHLHRPECDLLTGLSVRITADAEDVEDMVLPLRCMALKVQDPERWEQFKELQSHVEERKSDPIWMVDRYIWNALDERVRQAGIVDEDGFHSICGILDTNSFQICVGSMILRGVYPTASFMNHDCCANVRHYFDSDLGMHVKSTRTLPEGFEVKANYTQVLWGTGARRKHLMLGKHFGCTCDRCKDPTEFGTYLNAIRCPRCTRYMTPTRPLVDDAPWRCNSCDQRLTAEQVTFIHTTLGKVLQKVNKSDPPSVEKFVTKCEKLVPPCNHILVEMKYALMQMYGNSRGYLLPELHDETLERKRSLCAELLKVLRKIRTGACRCRGLLLYELHVTLMEMHRRLQEKGPHAEPTLKILRQEAYASLKEACYILEEDTTAPQDRERKLRIMEEAIQDKK